MMENDIALHFLAQPYLDISNGRHWKASVMKQIESMVFIEKNAKAHLSQGFRMSDEQRNYLFTTLEIMNLELVVHAFSAEGIMKRSS